MTGPGGLVLIEDEDTRHIEGTAGERVLFRVDDASLLVEQCLSSGVSRLLLHASNLTAGFFDLSSGEAGAVLQKLFQYRIRVAIVREPGSVRLSTRFGEMMLEEKRLGRVGLFDTLEEGRQWLRGG